MRGQRIKAVFRSGAIVLALLAVVSACQSVMSPQQSAALATKIQIGMSRADVVAQLGPSQRVETRGAIEFLFYQPTWHFADEVKDRNPVAIRDGKVVGLGVGYFESVTKIETSSVAVAAPAGAK